MKKEVIEILRGLRATDDYSLRWTEEHGGCRRDNWDSWHEALQVIEKRREELAHEEINSSLRNVARAHNLVNSGKLSKDAGIRVLTRACAILRDEFHLGYTGWENLEDLRAALYAASVDANNKSTWPEWLWSLWYDITPEWSGHEDTRGAHAALRATVEKLFPFDSSKGEEETGGLVSLHKGRRW